MRITADVLRRFVKLPEGRAIRMLLDDIGIEVKRHDVERDAFTVELLANRGDHHCYVGLAREVNGHPAAVSVPQCPS